MNRYSKNTWLARVGEGLNRWRDTISNTLFDFTNEPTRIDQAGTPISPTWLNNLESGVESALNESVTANVTAQNERYVNVANRNGYLDSLELEAVTLVNMLGKLGSFKNGTDGIPEGFTSLLTESESLDNGVLTFTATTAGAGISFSFDTTKNLDNRKYYVCADIKSDDVNVSLFLDSSVVDRHSANDRFERLSAIADVSTANHNSFISFSDLRTSGYEEIQVKNVMLIDITATNLQGTDAEIKTFLDTIEYFEDVKTTSGKIFSESKNKLNDENVFLDSALSASGELITSTTKDVYITNLKENIEYAKDNIESGNDVVFLDANDNIISITTSDSFTSPEGCVKAYVEVSHTDNNAQLRETSKTNDYDQNIQDDLLLTNIYSANQDKDKLIIKQNKTFVEKKTLTIKNDALKQVTSSDIANQTALTNTLGYGVDLVSANILAEPLELSEQVMNGVFIFDNTVINFSGESIHTTDYELAKINPNGRTFNLRLNRTNYPNKEAFVTALQNNDCYLIFSTNTSKVKKITNNGIIKIDSDTDIIIDTPYSSFNAIFGNSAYNDVKNIKESLQATSRGADKATLLNKYHFTTGENEYSIDLSIPFEDGDELKLSFGNENTGAVTFLINGVEYKAYNDELEEFASGDIEANSLLRFVYRERYDASFFVLAPSGGAKTEFENYEGILQTEWESRRPMPTERSELTVSAVNGKVYAIGGRTDSETRSAINEEYDPATNTWTTKASSPFGTIYSTASVVDGKIYVIGGDTSGVNENIEYDPVANSWRTRADIPTAREDLTSSVVNGKIYAIGGNTSNENENEEYDPSANSWRTRADMPTGRSPLVSGALGNKIYAVGDISLNATVNEEYDPSTNSWRTRASMPTARNDTSSAVLVDRMFVFGGDSTGGSGNTTVTESYSAETNSWQSEAEPPSFIEDAGAAAVNNKAYIIGGNIVGELQNTNSVFNAEPQYILSYVQVGARIQFNQPTTLLRFNALDIIERYDANTRVKITRAGYLATSSNNITGFIQN